MSELIQWVIFDNPADYPGKWVARQFVIAHGKISAGPAYVCDSLDAAREHVPYGLYCIGRQPGDQPQIKEVWT